MRRRCWWILCLLLSCLLMLGSAAAEATAAVVPTENILVAQSDSLLLYFNEDYTKFRLVDGLSGREWYSYMLESQIPEGERVNRTWKNRSQSLVLLHYTDAEANTGEVVTSDLTAAEKMDGASEWELFWKVTLPMMANVMLLTSVYCVIESFCDPSNPMVDMFYNEAFVRLKYSASAAMSWIYFLMVLIFVGLVFLLMKRFTYSEYET